MPFLAQPEMDLASTAKLGELGEYEIQSVSNAAVWILLDTVAARLHEASRDAEEQCTAARLLLERLLGSLAEQR